MRFWVPTIVFAAVLAAVLAFQGSLRQAGPPPPPQEPSFHSLQPGAVEERIDGYVMTLRERVRVQRATVGARRAAVAWLGSLPSGGRTPGGGRAAVPEVSARIGPQARQRVMAVGAWLDGLPANMVRIAPRGVSWVGADGSSPARVPATVTLRMPQTRNRARSISAPVTVTVAPTLAADGESVREWRVIAAAAPRRGLHKLEDPVVVVRGNVAVLAEARRRGLARLAAVEGAASLRELRSRYAGVSAPGLVGIYLLEDTALIEPLLRRTDRPPGTHAIGWTYETGDVVLDAVRLERTASTNRRRGTVRHELTHVVTLPLIEHAPTLVLEGVATMEEARLVTSLEVAAVDLAPLRAAFRARSLGYQELLTSTDTAFGRTRDAQVRLGYLAGYATISYLEEHHGRPKLLRFLGALRSGQQIDAALRTTYRFGPTQLQKAVRRWTADHVRIHGGQATFGTD